MVVAVLWGLVNHAGLGLLVGLLLARADGAGGAAMALNSCVTYAAAAVGTAAGGLLFELHGFTAVGAAAVVALVLAVVPAVRVR